MSKLKKQLRAYFDENLSHTDQYNTIATKANLQSTKKEKNLFMSKKLLLRIVLPCFLGLALIATIVVVGITRKKVEDPVDSTPAAVIQMDVNPSLSLVVDNNNVVISVYGENDEGKMIVCDMNLVGLSVDVAIEKIITEEVNTGYLIKGNVKAEENEINFVIEADTQQISTALEAKLNEVTTNVCQKLNVNKVVEIETKIEEAKTSLVARALELDPTAIKEELENKTNAELINYIAGCQIEKFTIPTEELEALYDSIKTSRVNLSEHEFVVNAIDSVDANLYQEFKSVYSALISRLKEANTALETAYYNYFVKAESTYQKALTQINEAKINVFKLRSEVAELKTKIAALEDGLEKTLEEGKLAISEGLLQAAEVTLATLEFSFDEARKLAKGIIDGLQTGLNQLIVEMETFQSTLPSEIKTVLTESVVDIENKINEAKDNSFAYFETTFKADIELALAQMKAQKQALVNELKK